MVGYLVSRKGRLRYFQEEVLGLPLLRCELPQRGRRERWERRAVSFLRRAGARGLLEGPEQPALPLTETGELYRRKAARLALLALEQRGIPREEAVVGLRASRYSRPMEETCQFLAKRVRALALELPQAEEVAWELQRAYGIPVFRGEGDVTLCFTPAEPGEGRLLLGERRPQVEWADFAVPGIALPEECPLIPLLALLCETGRLSWEEVQVRQRRAVEEL